MNIPVAALEAFGTALALQAFRRERIEQGRAKLGSYLPPDQMRRLEELDAASQQDARRSMHIGMGAGGALGAAAGVGLSSLAGGVDPALLALGGVGGGLLGGAIGAPIGALAGAIRYENSPQFAEHNRLDRAYSAAVNDAPPSALTWEEIHAPHASEMASDPARLQAAMAAGPLSVTEQYNRWDAEKDPARAAEAAQLADRFVAHKQWEDRSNNPLVPAGMHLRTAAELRGM